MTIKSLLRFVADHPFARYPFCKAFKGVCGVVLFFLLAIKSYAQWPDSMLIDVAAICYQKQIAKQCLFVEIAKQQVADAAIPSLPFKTNPVNYLHHGLPARMMEQDCFIQFALTNSADTAVEVCFSPGFFCRNITLFKARPDNIAGPL